MTAVDTPNVGVKRRGLPRPLERLVSCSYFRFAAFLIASSRLSSLSSYSDNT